MDGAEEPRSERSDDAVAKTELPPSITAPEMETAPQPTSEPAITVRELQVDAQGQQETHTQEVYDPTPVIRGYDASESEAPAIASPLVSEPQISASTMEPRLEAELEPPSAQAATSTPSVPDPPNAAVPETAAVVPSTTETPVVVDAFKSKVRNTWSLMFGSRYEDEDDDDHESNDAATRKPLSDATVARNRMPQPNAAGRTTHASSLRSKLDTGRKLDQQLQGGRRTRVRQRPGSDTTADAEQPLHTARSWTRPTKATGTWLAEEQPFHDAGLTPTIVRFCLEKAMISCVHCIAQLHAIAQDEPEPARNEVELGVFLTQWELDSILHDLFGATTTVNSTSSAHSQLYLHNAEYATLPQQTLLQVSWFLPLDQLPRLRSLVAQICRKHLSERKLAVLNAALHRHFVLRPHPGVKMQRLLLRILDVLMAKPPEAVKRVTGNQADEKEKEAEAIRLREESKALVPELLHAIYVRIPPSLSLTVQDFMRLAPFDLVTTVALTSVLTVQRIVFFRFLIEALGSEKANVSVGVNSWWPRSMGKPSTTSRLHQRRASEVSTTDESSRTPQRSVAKSRRKKTPDKTTASAETAAHQHDDLRAQIDSEAPVQSTHASHGSVGSPGQSKPDETTGSEEKSNESTRSDFTKLCRSLTVALGNLVKAQPWLVEDDDARAVPATASATAMRASFLAAEAFQQSLVLLESTGTSVLSSVLRKIQEFTDTINELTRQHDAVDVSQPPAYAEPPPQQQQQQQQPSTPRAQPAKTIPPPVQRGDSPSSIFPPPYVATTPSYWTFDPELPAPSTPTDNSSSIPRSVAKSKVSPGVGDYDLARSDKLTFLQRKGFTFAKSGLEPVAESSKTPTPKRRPRTERSNSVDASVSSEPPAYTHWASAAESPDRKTAATERLLIDEDEEDGDTTDVEARVREALRMQQSFALDDMVQSLLHRGRPVVSASRAPRPQSAASQPPSRVVSRVRSATTRANAPRAQPQPPAYTKRPTKPKPQPQEIQQPPRDYEPPADDAHLQWAARVSEFYQAKLKAVVASSGAS